MPEDAEAEVIALIAGAADEDPYSKWDGTHWRLVELADLSAMGTAVSMSEVRSMVDAEFRWLLGDGHVGGIRTVAGLTRAHASQEGTPSMRYPFWAGRMAKGRRHLPSG